MTLSETRFDTAAIGMTALDPAAAIDLAALPREFAWGTATSAYQIEGAVAEDGRAPPSGTPSPAPPAPSTEATPETPPATTTTDGARTSA